MRNLTYSIIVMLVAVLSISCGTDPLDGVDSSETLRFTNLSDLEDAASEGLSYNYTVDISNGVAIDVNLTSFSENGNWLNAEVSNDGSQILLTGTAPSVNSSTNFDYQLTGIKSNEKNASTSFSIRVLNNN